jgi:hypothetical protein
MKRRLAIMMIVILIAAQCIQVIPGVSSKVLADSGAPGEKIHFYITPHNFSSYGTWTVTGDLVQGRATASEAGNANPTGGVPAIAIVNIQSPGEYRLWVRDRDYSANQPGTRFFHVGVDGVQIDTRFGTHGQDGFRWSEVGVFDLNGGVHELSLIDSSGFYARSEGFFLTKDLNLIPPENKEELAQIAPPEDPFGWLPSADFPEWAEENIATAKTAVIENEKVKIVFHQGTGTQGALVQNEIFIKDGEEWVPVKSKTEQLGFLMMYASNSELVGQDGSFVQVKQELTVGENSVSTVVSEFFKSGIPTWFIPNDFEQVSTNQINLSFNNTEAELQVSFEFDELSHEPKVTLNAQFHEQGAYSFLLFNGNETAYEDYETVTAPLLYVKKEVPATDTMIPEPYLFTPMATLHYEEGNDRFGGTEMTSGIVMDPSSVGQNFSYPDTAQFALVLRGPGGDVRPQFAAPMFGTEHSLFEADSSYSVSYRIIHAQGSWYDTFKHVAEDLYKAKDIRTNVFHSLNEAIYNATDLMLDDDYGGWEDANMAHYNMEERDMTSTSNGMSALQRYLLTEDEELLDERVIPTIASMINHMGTHYKITDSKGGASYTDIVPTPIGGEIKQYSASVYGGLYEMTQGRMPYLLNLAMTSAAQQPTLAGVTDNAALYKYTGDQQYLDRLILLADRYLNEHPNVGENREKTLTTGFVYGHYIPAVVTLLAAYEATGDRKYLDVAEENAHLLTTSLWTTGYHEDYANSDYTVSNEITGTRLLNAEKYSFWWHGDRQWRLGNPDGYANPPQVAGPPIPTETQEGWLSARVGMGTEHAGTTPAHGNVITMNNWAGTFMKLAEYTGDDYFSNVARNAMIGRFGNYPGYYQDRMIFHQMKENYPYEGPDFTSIYFHHIPVFITMLEDFLINSAWAKSERNIEFPSLYQSGYAYFASNQFGHAPGTFYDEENMWLWLDRGIIEPDSVEIDYITAKKNGKLGVALMNEGNEALETTITLGDKVDPSSTYGGTATVYEADGTTTNLQVMNGQFTIAIPAKGIRSVVLNIPSVSAPGYANTDYEYSNQSSDTVSQHTRGKGYVLQVSPESYHAYVYVTDMADSTSKVTMNYSIGGQSHTAVKSGYPYEFLIKVEDPTAVFEYELIAEDLDEIEEPLGGGELKANDFSKSGIVSGDEGDDSAVKVRTWVSQTGQHAPTNTFRFVVPIEDFYPLVVTEDLLAGMKVNVQLRHKQDGFTMNVNSTVVANEMRTNRTMVVVVQTTPELKLGTYPDYDIQLSVSIPEEWISNNHGPYPLTVVGAGEALPPTDTIRLVVNQSDFPFTVTTDSLIGYRVVGTITHPTEQTVLHLDSAVINNEMRTNGTTILVVKPTAGVPRKAYSGYGFDLDLVLEPDLDSPINLVTSNIGQNTTDNVLRIVVAKDSLPFTMTRMDLLNGYRISGEIKNRTSGSILPLDSVIVGVESSGANYVLIVRPTSRVARNAYSSATYDYYFTLHPELTGTWKSDGITASGDYEYVIDPAMNTVTITRFTGTNTASIPETIAGLPVTSIGDAAFQNKRLTSATIPNSVTHIGHSAFRDNQLTNVTIPSGVGSIDDTAFRLNSLESVVVGGTEIVFGDQVFASNPAAFAIIGYTGSTAQTYAGMNSHSFVDIAPVVTFQTDGNETWSQSIETGVTVERHGDLLEYVWSSSSDEPSVDEDWQPFTSGETIAKTTGDGDWFLHIRITDLNGQPYAVHSQRFRLDGTDPALSITLTRADQSPYPEATWTDLSVSAAVYAEDSLSGLHTLEVSADSGLTWSDIENRTTHVLDDDGIHVIQFRARDLAGNETLVEKRIKISKQGLIMNTILEQGAGDPYTSGNWTNQSVTANVYAFNSNVIMVTSVTYSLNQGVTWSPLVSPLTFTEDGVHSLWIRAIDAADNQLTEQSIIRIDKMAPTVQFTPDGSEPSVTYATAVVTIQEAGIGVDTSSLLYIWSNSSITPVVDGSWQSFTSGTQLSKNGSNGDWFLHIRAADLLGNEIVTSSQRFRIYNAPPITEPEPGDNAEVGPQEPEQSEKQPQQPEESQELVPAEEPKNEDQNHGQTPGLVQFVDIQGHWSERSVMELVARGVIAGYTDGSFQPDKIMTRAEFITIIVRAFEVEERPGKQFNDTTGHWARDAISTAFANGLISGLSETSFGPNDSITREQMIVIIMRVLKGIAADQAQQPVFTDATEVSPWAQAAVNWAAEQGITSGYPDGSFRPSLHATRAEVIAIIVRALRLQTSND